MILMVLILLNLQVQQTIESEAFIKVTRFQVPPVVPAGASIRLSCIYELRDETLHAMKLFKDDKEFYRYTPTSRREDQKMAFTVKGINVDLARSNENNVTLKNVNKHTSGLFKCQVSVENTFRSVSAERRLKVEDQQRSSSSSSSPKDRVNAESLLAQTYQQPNGRQVIGISNKPSSSQLDSLSNGSSKSSAHCEPAVAQLLAYIIFQSILMAVSWIRPD